jgi:hypothetical protein
MIVALLLASAPVSSALDAEIAFARDAKEIGQWTAFRKWADRDAVMFTPKAVWAKTFLRHFQDPPRSISWRPAASYVSCDGRMAVNVGPWFTQDGRRGGDFTTVWQRTPSGWRWVYDGGIPARGKSVEPSAPKVERASCGGRPMGPTLGAAAKLKRKAAPTAPLDSGRGVSADRTLGWDWRVTAAGARTFRAFLWTGRRYAEVVDAIDPARKRR